jgi:hypothetical protein
VIVEWVLQLFREGLDLQTFVKELLMEGEGFFLELIDLRGLSLDNLQFAGQVTDLELQETDVFQTFLILDLSLAKCRL